MVNGNDQKTKRIAINTIVLFLRMFVLTIVNLYSVRFVLIALGIVDYGLYNVIAALVTMGTCISGTLATSIQRYYSFALGKESTQDLTQIFSSSVLLIIHLSLLIVFFFSIVGPWFISYHMTIPETRYNTVLYVFFFSLISFVITTMQIPFLAAVFAHEEMRVYSIISTVDSILKLLLAYFLCLAPTDRLMLYGVGLVFIAVASFLCYAIYALKNYHECKFCKVTNKGLLKDMLSFSGWNFYGTLTGVATIQGSSLILNLFFGPVTNTSFSVGNQLYNAMISLINSVIVAFRPAMIKSFSINDFKYFNKLFSLSNKIVFYLLLILTIPLFIDMRSILIMWLGERSVNEEIIVFAKLYVLYTLFLALHNPITILMQAKGAIRNYVLSVESIMLLGLPLSICFFYIGMPSYFLIVSLIITCIIAHIVRMMFLFNTPIGYTLIDYIKQFVIPAIVISLISSSVLFLLRNIDYSIPILHLAGLCMSSLVIVFVCLMVFGLTKEERTIVKANMYIFFKIK